jgi:excisionase family DNA binding protein
MDQTYYRYPEAAVKLDVAESTLRRWVSTGRIECHRLGRLVRFTDADLASAYTPTRATPMPRSPGRHRRRTGR